MTKKIRQCHCPLSSGLPRNPLKRPGRFWVPAATKIRVSENAKPAAAVKPAKKQTGADEKPAPAKRRVSKMPTDAVRKNASVDSLCSTDSSSSSSSSSSLSAGSAKMASSSRRRLRLNGDRGLASATAALGVIEAPPPAEFGTIRRCDWITANSEPLYVSFHDEEWGVPVHDDTKLFELLVLSIALAEHTWVSILSKRDLFRMLFDRFDPSSVAKLSEEKLLSLSSGARALLSKPKLRSNSRKREAISQVQEEFGSFSNYCWRFVNDKPIRNGYRYARQVPTCKDPEGRVY